MYFGLLNQQAYGIKLYHSINYTVFICTLDDGLVVRSILSFSSFLDRYQVTHMHVSKTSLNNCRANNRREL